MNDYEVMLERCKREDTKELIITCLDKASIDNKKQMHDDFLAAFEIVGCILAILIIGLWISTRIFK
jgi:hypothetical protein